MKKQTKDGYTNNRDARQLARGTLPALLLRRFLLQQVRCQLGGVVGAVVAQQLQLGVVLPLESFSFCMGVLEVGAAL